MNNKTSFGIGGVVVGLVLASVFGSMMSPVFWNNSGRMMGNYRNTDNSQITSNIDKHFIEQMIPHHDGAIAMATLALEKSKRPEIKTLANTIIKEQNEEIENMISWYKNWFGKDVSKTNTSIMGGGLMSVGGMHMGGKEDIKILENAADFDEAFIEGMIPHHQLAIMMAQMLRSGTNRFEMLTLANNIIESQSREITKMQGWYNNWYK